MTAFMVDVSEHVRKDTRTGYLRNCEAPPADFSWLMTEILAHALCLLEFSKQPHIQLTTRHTQARGSSPSAGPQRFWRPARARSPGMTPRISCRTLDASGILSHRV